jgi:dTDP-4-amino-4,6-dideoxygalactose transaminase
MSRPEATVVPLVDIAAQYATLEQDVLSAVTRVIRSGTFINGPECAALETEIAEMCGVTSAIGVASGTDALRLALWALGIGEGDEVLVPALTFAATAEAVVGVGARPVFADVDRAGCIDAADCERRLTAATRAVIPVHLYGGAADMGGVMALAGSSGLRVVEDAAQALGATYEGRPVGSFGDAGAASFYPTKNLGAAGDGGMVLTSDDDLADRIRLLANHGTRRKYRPEVVGTNSRLDEVQAAILRVKLTRLAGWNDRRREIAARYSSELRDVVEVPDEIPGRGHVYHLYVIRAPNRDAVSRRLAEAGVASAVVYPIPLPFTDAMEEMGHERGDFPVAERLSSEVLSLPLFPEMTDEQLETVCAAVRAAVK